MTQPSPWDYPGQQATGISPTSGSQEPAHRQPVIAEQQVAHTASHGTYDYSAPVQATPRALRKQEDLLLNILLYLASLLIVSAAGLFLSRAASPLLKVLLLVLCSLAFYGSGILTYRVLPKLRLASYSFVGTALALVPLVGYAFHSEYGGSGRLTWLITSVVGTLGVLGAATIMQGRFMSYLFVGFMVSNMLALTKVIGLGFIWYFVVLMILATVLGLFAHYLPGKLPATLQRGFVDTSVIFVPALVVCLYFFIYRLSHLELALILGLASVHAGVFTFLRRSALHYIQLRVFPLLALTELGTALAPSHGYPLGWWLAAAAALTIALVLPSTSLVGLLPGNPSRQQTRGRFRWSASADAHLTLTSTLLLVLGASASIRSWVLTSRSQIAEVEPWARLSPLVFMEQGGMLPHLWFFVPLYLLAIYRWLRALSSPWHGLAYAGAALLLLTTSQTLSSLAVTVAVTTFLIIRVYRQATPHRAVPLSLPVVGYTLALVLVISDLVNNRPFFIVSLGLLACGALGLATFTFEQYKDRSLAAQFPISTLVGGQSRELAPVRWTEPIVFASLSAVGAMTYQPPVASLGRLSADPGPADYIGWSIFALLLLANLAAGVLSYRYLTPGTGPSNAQLVLIITTQALGLMSARFSTPIPVLSYVYLLLMTVAVILLIERIHASRYLASLVVRINFVLAAIWYLLDYSSASYDATAHILISLFTLLSAASVALYAWRRHWLEAWLFLGFTACVYPLLVFSPDYLESYLATAALCLLLIVLAVVADRLNMLLSALPLSVAVFALCAALWNHYSEQAFQWSVTIFNLFTTVAVMATVFYILALPAPGTARETLDLPTLHGRILTARSRLAVFPLLSLHTLCLVPELFSQQHTLVLALIVAITGFIWCFVCGSSISTALTVALAAGIVRACFTFFADSALFAFFQLIALVFTLLISRRVIQQMLSKTTVIAPVGGLFAPALIFQAFATLIAATQYTWFGKNIDQNLLAFIAVLGLIVLAVLSRRTTVVALAALLLLFHLTLVVAGFSIAQLFVLGLAIIAFVILRLIRRPAEPDLLYQAQAQAQAQPSADTSYQRQPWDYPGRQN